MPLETFKCSCADWEENILLINAHYGLGLIAVGQYTGKRFTHCPWCGSELLMAGDGFTYTTRYYKCQCNCGMPAFKESSGGCPEHGANEFGESK